MKSKSLVYILSFLLTFGMMVSFVHSDSDTVPEKQETETKETKAYESLTDEEKKEVNKKVQEVLEKLEEGIETLADDELFNEDALKEKLTKAFKNLENVEDVTVKVITSSDMSDFLKDPDSLKEFEVKIKELVKDENLDDEALNLKKKIKELVENLDLLSSFDIDEDNVKVITSEPIVITKVLKTEKNLSELTKKVVELAKDENLDEDQLTEKLKELLKDSKFEPIIVSDKDNVKVIVAGESFKAKGLTEFAENIAELAKDEDLDEDQLAEKVKEMIKEKPSVFFSGIDIGDIADVKVLKSGSIVSSHKSKDATEIKKLTERVEKLEKEIDALIEKLDKITSK